MPRPRKLPVGVHRDRHGYRVFIRVNGRLRTRRFRAETPLDDLVAWRTRQRATGVLVALDGHTPGTLAEDIPRYLALVAAMPTAQTRTTQLLRWREALGPTRDRHTITPTEIATTLLRWQHDEAWAAGTVNRHRTALSHFYRLLDGPGGFNPVRAVPKQREPLPRPRGLEYRVVRALLAALPGRTTSATTRAPSKAAAMLRVMAYTGLAPAQIRLLRPEHLDLRHQTLLVPGRRKGAGTAPRRRALTAPGVEALRQFAAAEAWGGVAGSTLLIVFRRAVRQVRRQHRRWPIPPDVRPYDLRHSFAELVYRTTHSLAITAGLLGHADERTSRRYVAGAVEDVERDAARQITAALREA